MIERENERVALLQPVTLDSSSGRRDVRVTDLSTGGCYVDCIALVNPGEAVRLKFVLPNDRIEEISGTVAYVHEGIGFGVKFGDLTREQQAVLEQLVIANGGTV